MPEPGWPPLPPRGDYTAEYFHHGPLPGQQYLNHDRAYVVALFANEAHAKQAWETPLHASLFRTAGLSLTVQMMLGTLKVDGPAYLRSVGAYYVALPKLAQAVASTYSVGYSVAVLGEAFQQLTDAGGQASNALGQFAEALAPLANVGSAPPQTANVGDMWFGPNNVARIYTATGWQPFVAPENPWRCSVCGAPSGTTCACVQATPSPDLQQAIMNAEPGDAILLEGSETFSGTATYSISASASPAWEPSPSDAPDDGVHVSWPTAGVEAAWACTTCGAEGSGPMTCACVQAPPWNTSGAAPTQIRVLWCVSCGHEAHRHAYGQDGDACGNGCGCACRTFSFDKPEPVKPEAASPFVRAMDV
jgi:hypothetical protein